MLAVGTDADTDVGREHVHARRVARGRSAHAHDAAVPPRAAPAAR